MNRNKLIEVFSSNLANAVIHQILEKAIDKSEIAQENLPEKDSEEIKRKIINKVRAELKLRIDKGYENIDISLVEEFVEKALKETGIK